MLQKLSISNYAIIDDIEIDFGSGLNILTGETGAGKSIIIGALSLLLGERADVQLVKQGAIKCTVEAIFAHESPLATSFLKEYDFDHQGEEICIRREVYSAGKSRAFINDTPATLQQLALLADYLIDIHRQHQTLSLQQRAFQLLVVDSLADNQQRLHSYQTAYSYWQKQKQLLADLKESQNKMQAEYDFNLFQYNELQAASLSGNDEQEQLEAELKMLENAEELQIKLNEVLQLLNQDEVNATAIIKSAQSQLSNILKKLPQAESVANRLLELREQLRDINHDIEDLLRRIENNPQRMEEVQERLNTINTLLKKHRVSDVNSLIRIQEDLEKKLNNVSQLDEQIAQLEKECHQLHRELLHQAEIISEHRKNTIPAFEKQIKQLLKSVGMPHAELKVQLQKSADAQLHINGMDTIEFLFSANKGSAPQPIQKMASGGELSRLMLCIKTIIARSAELPTLVFDEIDNGISGETAQQVGLLMKKLAVSHQVICITHLPQIAAKADTHLYIYKEQKQNNTITRLRKLSEEERVIEIAKMLSGEKPGNAALQNAKELIDL